MPVLSRRFLAFALAALAIPGAASAAEFNTDKIGDVLKRAHRDLTLVCAHRGLHGTAIGTNAHPDWLRNVPENSIAAIQQAASNGIECSEIDLRLDRNGQVVVLHDSNLGRTTNAYATVGGTPYDPYAQTGYNPNLGAYTGNTAGLALRMPNLNGYTTQKLPTPPAVLDAIKANKISMILLLDVKDIEAAKRAWQIVKTYANWWGTPAERWVYFKMPVSSIGTTATEFEAKGIMAPGESARFRLIPVFGADFIDAAGGPVNALRDWRGYYDKAYVYATEVRLKEYDSAHHYPLNNIVGSYYASRTTGNVKTLGAYQPVPETTHHDYFAADGHCCTDPRFWLWKSQHGYGQETGDNRESLNWLMNTAGQSFSYIITDDPTTAIAELDRVGRRNTSLIRNP